MNTTVVKLPVNICSGAWMVLYALTIPWTTSCVLGGFLRPGFTSSPVFRRSCTVEFSSVHWAAFFLVDSIEPVWTCWRLSPPSTRIVAVYRCCSVTTSVSVEFDELPVCFFTSFSTDQ